MSAWLRGSPLPCAMVRPLNYLPCLRNLTAWAISSRPWMPLLMPPSRIAANTNEDLRWDARRVQMPLAAQCGASTPVLRQATESLPLTDREAEIVMLIGAGLSNRAVAEKLTLSIRTVESHIYRAMMKTGTTSRDELAALMPRHGSSK